MATKPTDGHLEWITDDDTSKYIAPSAGKKLQGWIQQEKPPFQYFNWAWRLIDRWLQYCEQAVDEILSSIMAKVDADEAIAGATEKTFTGLEAGKRYRLEFELAQTITDAQLFGLLLRFGNSGGIDTGGNYGYLREFLDGSGPSHALVKATAQSAIAIASSVLTGPSTEPMFGHVEFSTQPGDGTIVTGRAVLSFKELEAFNCHFIYDGASAVDRVQLLTDAAQKTIAGRARLFRTN